MLSFWCKSMQYHEWKTIMLKVGIISTWHVHTDGYAKELVDSGKAQITALWEEDAEKGKAWAEQHGAVYEPDYDKFLTLGFDAVVCNAPTTQHPRLLHKAIAAGKHIFTEKLLATTAAECQKLCEALEKSGLTFTISLPLRSSAPMLYAKKLVEDGTLGRVSGARMRRSHSGVSDGWLPDYWFDTSKTGGGAMMDLGAHPVYMLSFLFGAPKRLSGMGSNLFGTSGDENSIAVVEFAGGILGTCETAFVTSGVPDLLEVYGTEGSLFIRGDKVELALKGAEPREVAPSELPAALPSPILRFADACLDGSGTPQYLGTEDALVMTRMIEAFYASDKNNKTIILN